MARYVVECAFGMLKGFYFKALEVNHNFVPTVVLHNMCFSIIEAEDDDENDNVIRHEENVYEW